MTDLRNRPVQEVWQPVQGYEGLYEVSDQGRVRSLDRTIRTSRGAYRLKGKLLKPRKGSGGYMLVSFYDVSRRAHKRVHVLVLETFLGDRPSSQHDACHNDGNPGNNALCNLRWDTRKENHRDLVRHGTAWFLDPIKLEAQRERCRQNSLRRWRSVIPPNAGPSRPNPLMHEPFRSAVAQ